jgi:hypothetical protein
VSRTDALLARLEQASDWLSPLVVKEVRQFVRGREFTSSLGASLMAGLLVAFFGAADALTGEGASGGWAFAALMTCLAINGLAVVPLGAFSALRNERMEQTLELITLTALSPRRVVIGKLLAQGVKLATIFAAVAPFIAMSFLLGGIDFVTILASLLILFMWSLWVCAACLFLSTLLKSRAMSGLVFGGAAIVLFMVFGLGRAVFFFAGRGMVGGPFPGMGTAAAPFWWTVAILMSACVVTMVNLLLLAENRLSLATENRVTALRIGFLVQFLVIVGWTLSFIAQPPRVQSNAVEMLGVLGGLHLALVAMFTVTEDLVVPRRVMLQVQRRSLFAMFLPGGGRGAAYVLAQMAILVLAAAAFRPPWDVMRWVLAICGYICYFTAVPTLALRVVKPAAPASLILRVGILLLVPISLLLPDILHYVLWRPDALSLQYGARHLINPLRTLANWGIVETRGWVWVPTLLGLTGVLACLLLIQIGRRMTAPPAVADHAAAAAGEPGSVHALH